MDELEGEWDTRFHIERVFQVSAHVVGVDDVSYFLLNAMEQSNGNILALLPQRNFLCSFESLFDLRPALREETYSLRGAWLDEGLIDACG